MANVKFPRKEVEKHIKLDDRMLDRIMMLGIPVESLTDDEEVLREFFKHQNSPRL